MERHVDKKCKWYNKTIIDEKIDICYMLLCLLILVYPFIVIPSGYGYFYMPRYVFLLVISVLGIPLLYREKKQLLSKFNLLIIIFILFMIISTVNSYDTLTAWFGLQDTRFTGVSTYIFCIVIYLLAIINEKTENLFNYMISACAIVSIIAIMQHFGLNIVPHESYRDRFPPYGTIGQHNFLATYTVFILPASILYFLKSKKTYWLICSVLIFSGLLVSTTRGGWLAFIITYLIIIDYCFKHKELIKPLVKISIIFFIATCFLFSTKNGLLFKRAGTIPDNIISGVNLEDCAGSNRMYIWKKVIELVPQYWTFGIGPDNLIYAGIRLGSSTVDKAHNIYLEMLITMGVFTLVSYLVFLGLILKNCIREHKFLYFIMIFTYLIQGFFNIDTIMVMPIFWIVLGLSQNKHDLLYQL